MSKRAAESQLTRDAADEEGEEQEDAGYFEKASQSELEGRVFKKARRTLPATSSTAVSSGPGLFSGIRLAGLLAQQKNGLPSPPLQLSTSSSSISLPSTTAHTSVATSINSTSVSKPTFLSELRNLNTSVNDWIAKHVRENPYVDLTPIFRDYEQHLRELDQRFQQTATVTMRDVGSEVTNRPGSQRSDEREMEGGREEGGEEGGEKGNMDEESNKPHKTPTADEEEEGAVFSVRAKLFFKKSAENEFTELGIGQMRVLPSNREGMRVVMRNDTTLAKVLLNVWVTDSIPVSSKKNNVFLVCVPNPPLEKTGDEESSSPQSAVTYLIRVKTDTLAAGLLQALRGTDV